MRGESDLFSLFIYISIGLLLALCLFLLEKINKILNIYYLDIAIEVLKKEDNIRIAWLFAIFMVIMLWSGFYLQFLYFLFCCLVVLFLEMKNMKLTKENKKPREINYGVIYVFMVAGVLFISLAK